MPTTVTYPGVYIEEIPSGVRTIVGVATSITAFLGRALRGPVNEPVTINSFGDFERIFGGLWVDSAMSYAVRDFYLNGGSQAIIVRLYNSPAGPPPPATPAKAQLDVGPLNLEAASEGAWGRSLSATLSALDSDVATAVAERLGVGTADLFNLTVTDTSPNGTTEQFFNLTLVNSSRRVDKVLAAESQLVRWRGAWLSSPLPTITPGTASATGGSNGQALTQGASFTPTDANVNKLGLYALLKAELFNLLCIPPYTSGGGVDDDLISKAAQFCEKQRAFLIVDPPPDRTKASIGSWVNGLTRSKNAAVFFPNLIEPNPLRENQLEEFAPCGAVAGIFARTDAQRGVWKAPAGLDATLVGVPQLKIPLTDAENGDLNPKGINCLRSLPAAGRVVWGARTLQGDDRLASEWKYIPVRRLALFIEESLYRGTQWVVFEPNDEPLWSQIRLNAGAFMHNLFRQGAFQGRTPRDAYFVKCDSETTTQNDINLGIVNIIIGFAPLKPAEFVIIKIQQLAGQIAT